MTTHDDPAHDVDSTGDDPKGFGLHRRLLERDPDAVEAFWLLYFNQLANYASSKIFDTVTRDDVGNTLAMHVITAMIDGPERFDPTRGKSLYGYLMMDLKGDIKNYIARVTREPRQIRLDAPIGGDDDGVGNQDLGGNLPSGEPGPEEIAESVESQARVSAIRDRVVETDDEGIVFDLQYVAGERTTEAFAGPLGISGLPQSEQAQVVQKLKDRLAKRLRRMKEDQR